ncbi:beta-lactamase family protein [Porticoccaceae bacterium]|nr:beta-lactamase family protein [Porticoccaceae bacterium]
MSASAILENFQAYAEGLIDTHHLPAISLAVWHKNQLHQAAAGILNIETSVEATTDSIFQIGSISKVMTASVVMQLVDEGKVVLDKPVKHYIRDFAIADADATKKITVRHLLNHSNGISGDYCPDDTHDTGDLIARYVDRCNQLPLVHPVGECYSYSNAAFAIAGRLIEVITGGSWFDAIEERIFQPLGMGHSICRPMDVLRYRAAIGHVLSGSDQSNAWQQAKNLYLTLGLAPAGAAITMSAADVITFARAHINKGLPPDGHRWLSEESVVQMQTPQIELPSLSSAVTSHMGLSWGLHQVNVSGRLIFGHGGGTFGQMSMLRIVPDRDLCIAVLVNCENAEVAYQTVINELLKELGDIDLTEPKPTYINTSSEQHACYVGDYGSPGEHYSIALEGNELVATYQDIVVGSAAIKLTLKAIDKSLWATFDEKGCAVGKLRFLQPDAQGHYRYLFNTRMLPRISHIKNSH